MKFLHFFLSVFPLGPNWNFMATFKLQLTSLHFYYGIHVQIELFSLMAYPGNNQYHILNPLETTWDPF